MSEEMIEIDGKAFAMSQLSDAAKGNIVSIQFCDERIQQLSSEWAVADTARMAYEAALQRELNQAKG